MLPLLHENDSCNEAVVVCPEPSRRPENTVTGRMAAVSELNGKVLLLTRDEKTQVVAAPSRWDFASSVPG